MPSITFDKRKLKAFKKAYNTASGEVFTFDGVDFLKSYAKYLIEYLEQRFNAL